MARDNPTRPITPDLGKLERRIDDLIRVVERLDKENRLLKERQQQMTVERANLIEKSELARTRVEAIITRLKSMEND